MSTTDDQTTTDEETTGDITEGAINFDALPETVRTAYTQAVENGWNYQLKLEPTDTTKPALIIAVIQPDSLPDWVGLLDEGTLVVSGDGTPA